MLANGADLEDLIRSVGPSRPDSTPEAPGYQQPYHWQDESKITFTSVKTSNDTMARARMYVLGVSVTFLSLSSTNSTFTVAVGKCVGHISGSRAQTPVLLARTG
jgi:hypothetical protein